jgi:catechol 2,3-dioxygenase-like lactoylglutathione lyase family enzyme
MLGRHDVGATLAVADIAAARSFYEDTLGLTPAMEMDGAVVYSAGNSRLLVYRSDYAGTNGATAATWEVGDELDTIVDALRGKGVTFEHYDDLPGVTRDGDLHDFGGVRGVWFKDPDGNIIAVMESP